jgi:hypothetical protein
MLITLTINAILRFKVKGSYIESNICAKGHKAKIAVRKSSRKEMFGAAKDTREAVPKEVYPCKHVEGSIHTHIYVHVHKAHKACSVCS